MTKKLTGAPTLAYLGVTAAQPANSVQIERPPTTQDYFEYNIGDYWLDISSLSQSPPAIPTVANLWILVSKQRHIASWVNFASGSPPPIVSLIADDGNEAFPIASGVHKGEVNVFSGTSAGQILANLNTTADNVNTERIALNSSILQPPTNAAGTQGIYALGTTGYTNDRFLYNYGTHNTFVGYQAGNLTLTVASAVGNTAVGQNAMDSLTTGAVNCAFGSSALTSATTSVNNTAIGASSLGALTTGSGPGTGGNTAVGSSSLLALVTGVDNTAIGAAAGQLYTAAESNNVLLQNPGVAGESNVMRLGTPLLQTTCFISGIRGVTTANNNAVAVLVDSASQLGTISSSKKYKENIEDMDDQSSIIMDLRPVTFNFKKFPDAPAWGLIAEEVDEIFPQLVVYDEDGSPESVKYHELVPLLLNELQKLNKRVNELELLLQGEEDEGI